MKIDLLGLKVLIGIITLIFALGFGLGMGEYQIMDLQKEQAKLETIITYLDQKIDGHNKILAILEDRQKKHD